MRIFCTISRYLRRWCWNSGCRCDWNSVDRWTILCDIPCIAIVAVDMLMMCRFPTMTNDNEGTSHNTQYRQQNTDQNAKAWIIRCRHIIGIDGSWDIFEFPKIHINWYSNSKIADRSNGYVESITFLQIWKLLIEQRFRYRFSAYLISVIYLLGIWIYLPHFDTEFPSNKFDLPPSIRPDNALECHSDELEHSIQWRCCDSLDRMYDLWLRLELYTQQFINKLSNGKCGNFFKLTIVLRLNIEFIV